jgi:hypothetical protein
MLLMYGQCYHYHVIRMQLRRPGSTQSDFRKDACSMTKCHYSNFGWCRRPKRFYIRLRYCNRPTRPSGVSVNKQKKVSTTTSRADATRPPSVTFLGRSFQVHFVQTVPVTGRLEKHVLAPQCK